MRTFIGSLILFLSVTLAQAAQVFPASTNGNNVFTGHNTFTQPINGNGAVITNVTPFTNTALLWVDKAGGNGVRGSAAFPYATPSAAASAALKGDTIVLLGPNTSPAAIATTNVNWIGYGSVITNTQGNSVSPRILLNVKNAQISGLTITNTADGTLCSAALGIEDNAPTTSLDAYDLNVFSKSYGAFYYCSNTITARWHDCRFVGNYQPFNAGTGRHHFYGCIFENDGASEFAFNSAGAYITYLFSADGFHGPDVSSTNTFDGCTFRGVNNNGSQDPGFGGEIIGFEIEFQSWNELNGCTIDLRDTSGTMDTLIGVNFIEENETVYLNGGTIFVSGATNVNLVAKMVGTGPYTLYLNGTSYYPTTNGVCVDNGANQVFVSGGNFIPANFSNPANVTWASPPGNGSTATIATTNGSALVWLHYTNGLFYGATTNSP